MKGGTESGRERGRERQRVEERKIFHVHAHLCTFSQFLVVCLNSMCDINTLIYTHKL